MNDDLKALEGLLEEIASSSDDQGQTATEPPADSNSENATTSDTSPSLQEADDDEKVYVFLSYLNDDAAIADVVQQELMGVSERVSVFKAHDDMRLAANWRQDLHNEIRKASFFLMLYTDPDKDWQWPIFEATTFENVHLTNPKDGENVDAQKFRLCCLHDTKYRPRPLEEFQSYQVTMFDKPSGDHDANSKLEQKAFYERSPLFNFFKKFIEYPNEPLRDLETFRENLLGSVQNVAEAFHRNRLNNVIREEYYPARIELTLGRLSDQQSIRQAVQSASVFLGPVAERLFGLKKENLSWVDFRQHFVKDNNGREPLWMSQMEEALSVAYDENIPDANTAVLYSRFSKRFYRPILSRQLFYLGGGRKFIIVLVEEPPIDFSDQSQMGLLLAGLILGSRFRFQFVDLLPQQLKEQESEEDLDDLLRSIGRRIDWFETEAAMHGLMDREALVNCYSNGDQEMIEDLYTKWDDVREQIFAAIQSWTDRAADFDTTKKKLSNLIGSELLRLNKDFMLATGKRYQELVAENFGERKRNI